MYSTRAFGHLKCQLFNFEKWILPLQNHLVKHLHYIMFSTETYIVLRMSSFIKKMLGLRTFTCDIQLPDLRAWLIFPISSLHSATKWQKVNCYKTVQFMLIELLVIDSLSFHNTHHHHMHTHIMYIYIETKLYHTATQHPSWWILECTHDLIVPIP